MKSYSNYKDSGVKWLGQIPQHWEEKKLRYFLESFSEKNHPSEQLLSVVREQGVIVRDITSKDENHNYIPEDLSGYKLIDKGDFAINKMKAWQGSYSISQHRGIVSPAYYTCHFRNADKEFFNIAIRSKAYVPFFTQFSKGIRVGQWDLPLVAMKNIPFFLPPLSEQLSIVSYLDGKVSAMDRLVLLTQQKVEHLKALKQAIIQQAVTQGIPNKNHILKHTNIKWIKQIPQHWEEKKIKYILAECTEKGFPNEPVLCSTQKYGVIPQSMYENRVVVVNKGLEGLKLVRRGDFVISLRSFQGGIEYAHYQGIISAAYTVLRLQDDVNPNYLRILFKTQCFIQLLQTCVTGIREGQNINYGLLRKNSIPLPPLSEQEEIVAYLDEKTAKIDLLIDKELQQIDHIKDLKQTLIADVVTGKVDVTAKY
jgi:type I restriction-modification protein